MDKKRIVKQLSNINRIVGPLGFVVFIIFVFLKYRTIYTSIFVILYSLIMLLDGLLSLKYPKASVEKGLQRLKKSNITQEEKIKKEKIILRWQSLFNICKIIGPIGILLFLLVFIKT